MSQTEQEQQATKDYHREENVVDKQKNKSLSIYDEDGPVWPHGCHMVCMFQMFKR